MERTRLIQIGFFVLLAISAAQVGWWLLDQVLFASSTRAMLEKHLESDERAAQELLERGAPPEQVAELFDELVILTDTPPHANPAFLEQLDQVQAHRMRRYAWEGSFFLLVLIAAMAVLWRTLREEARLRRSQQNFLAAVSHEFKSPLASIRLAAETLEMREPSPDRRRTLVRRILGNLARVEMMVTNLLDAARIEEGRLVLHREDVPLAQVVQNVLATAQARIEAAGVTISAKVPPELRVRADPQAVETVLTNLVDNARKAVKKKGGGRIEIFAEERGDRIALIVEDSGAGFAPEEAPRLFAKFYRPGDELRRGGQGSGLGLYIVERLVRASGGRIEAHSGGPGAGARFITEWLSPEDVS